MTGSFLTQYNWESGRPIEKQEFVGVPDVPTEKLRFINRIGTSGKSGYVCQVIQTTTEQKTVRNSLSCSNVAGTSMDHGAS